MIYRLSMGRIDIERKDVKILGLTIDHKLTFNPHVAKIEAGSAPRYLYRTTIPRPRPSYLLSRFTVPFTRLSFWPYVKRPVRFSGEAKPRSVSSVIAKPLFKQYKIKMFCKYTINPLFFCKYNQ